MSRSARALALLLPLAVAACGGPQAPKPSDLDGTWTGPMHTVGGRCADGVDATLLIDGDRVLFSPASGVLTLEGHRKPDDTALHAQLLLNDMNHKPLPMVFEGRSAPEQAPDGHPSLRIDGTYGTPTCRASVVLRRPAAQPWKNLLGR